MHGSHTSVGTDNVAMCTQSQDPIDAKAVAKGLERKSLLQVVGQGYHMHDVLLDFAKVTIEGFRNIKAIATQRQAQYLGRLKALRACVENGATGPPFYLLLSLWRSLEELSGDNQLEVRTYTSSLKELEGSETGDAAVTYFNAGVLFAFQVSVGGSSGLQPRRSYVFRNLVEEAYNQQQAHPSMCLGPVPSCVVPFVLWGKSTGIGVSARRGSRGTMPIRHK